MRRYSVRKGASRTLAPHVIDLSGTPYDAPSFEKTSLCRWAISSDHNRGHRPPHVYQARQQVLAGLRDKDPRTIAIVPFDRISDASGSSAGVPCSFAASDFNERTRQNRQSIPACKLRV